MTTTCPPIRFEEYTDIKREIESDFPSLMTTRFGELAFPIHLSNSFAQLVTKEDGQTTIKC